MPRIGGLLALRELKNTKTTTRILLLTAAIEQADIVTAFQLGAQGVVLKDTASDMLFKSIQAVMSGQYWVGPQDRSPIWRPRCGRSPPTPPLRRGSISGSRRGSWRSSA